MNNCYGKNENMQMPLVKIYPEFGDVFYIKCCVSDTDDRDIQAEDVDVWIDENMFNVDYFELIDGVQDRPRQLHLMFKADEKGDEFEVYLPENFEEDDNGNLLDWVTDYFRNVNYDVI